MTPFETWRQSHVTQLMGDFEDSMTKALTEAYLHGCHDGHTEGYLVGAREAQDKTAHETPPPSPIHSCSCLDVTSCGLHITEHKGLLRWTAFVLDVTCQPCLDAMRSVLL